MHVINELDGGGGGGGGGEGKQTAQPVSWDGAGSFIVFHLRGCVLVSTIYHLPAPIYKWSLKHPENVPPPQTHQRQ